MTVAGKSVVLGVLAWSSAVVVAGCAPEPGKPTDDDPAVPLEAPAHESTPYHPDAPRERRTMDVDGKTVAYTVVDGMVVVGGDMLFGPVGEGETRLANFLRADPTDAMVEEPGEPLGGLVPRGHIQSSTSARWPAGVLNYTWHSSCPAGSECRNAVLSAMSAYVDAQVGVQFRDCTNCFDRVRIKSDEPGCFATIGHQPFGQVLNLGGGCKSRDVAIHELGHALGMHHEHQRFDRDAYVSVKVGYAQLSQWDQFEKLFWGARVIGPYDYRSIMHYWTGSFSVAPGLSTIVPKNWAGPVGSLHLSCGDLATLRLMYGGVPSCSCVDSNDPTYGVVITPPVETRCASGFYCSNGACLPQWQPPPLSPFCGDGTCNNDETPGSCPSDCCAGQGASCSSNGDCCGGLCDGAGLCSCLSQGAACTSDAQCCSAPCLGGLCGAME